MSFEEDVHSDLERLHDEMLELESETRNAESDIDTDIRDIDEKIERLEEEVDEIGIDNQKYVRTARLFVQTAKELAFDIKSEREIRNLLEEFEKDKKEIQDLVNRIKNSDKISDSFRNELLAHIDEMEISDIFESESHEEQIEIKEENKTREETEKVLEIGQELEEIGKRGSGIDDNARFKVVKSTGRLEELI